ncbi:MAG: hypothetical protein WCC97_02025 [Candidatus Acidiferrales bacterium]
MGAATAEAVIGQYDKLQADRAKLLDLIQEGERKLGTLASEKQRLLVRIADGDRAASSRADHLDEQKIQCEREIGGLQIKLGEVNAALAPLSESRKAIYQEQADETRRKHFADLKAGLEIDLHNREARYRIECRARFELSEKLARIDVDPVLDEPQRNFLRTMVFQKEHSLGPVWLNERWQLARGPLKESMSRIVPAKPPEENKSLEILK